MIGVACQLKLPQQCVSTAMIIFHKYTLRKEGFDSKMEREICGLASLFLATKLCNYLVSVSKFQSTYPKMQCSSESGVADKILEYELCILSEIGFDLNIDLPYSFVEKMKPYFEDNRKLDKYIKIVYNFLNDSFKIPLCLYYSPITVSMAAFYLLSTHFKVNLVDTKDNKKWYNFVSDQVSFEDIVEVANLMNNMYESIKKIRGSLTSCNDSQSDKPIDLSFLNKKREDSLSVEEKKTIETNNYKVSLPETTLSSQ